MALKKRYPLRLVYISSSKSDQADFRANIVNHEELLLLFETKVKFLSSASEAIAWLRSCNKAEIDAIDVLFFDPLTIAQGSTQRLSEFFVLVTQSGLLKDQIIALTDTEDSNAIWIELKHRLGNNRVFGKQDALTPGGWEPLNEVITAVAERRSDSGTTNLNFTVIKVEARLEVLAAKLDVLTELNKDRVIDVDDRLEQLKEEFRILSQTVFQGPSTQAPSIITRLLEVERMTQYLDRSIGNLADSMKARGQKLENRVSSLESCNLSDKDKESEFKNTLKLKNIDLRDKIFLIAVGLIGSLLFGFLGDGSLAPVLDILMKALAGK